MKTIKIFLSILGFALSAFCFGQLDSESRGDLLFYSSYYDLASNRMEHYVNPYPARINYGDHFEAPLSNKTFFVPIEYDMAVEEWMTKPFESSFYEEDIQVEFWMTEPFQSLEEMEGEIEIEQWMTRPF